MTELQEILETLQTLYWRWVEYNYPPKAIKRLDTIIGKVQALMKILGE